MVADIPTLLLMITVASVVMACVLVVVAGQDRRNGLGLWGAALCLNALAYVLLILRGRIPDPVSILLGNALASATLSFLHAAVLRFQHRPLHWALLLAPPAVLTGVLALHLQDFGARILWANAFMALQMGGVFWVLFERRHATAGRGALMIMCGMGMGVAVLLARALWGASGMPAAPGLLLPGTIAGLTFMLLFVVLLIASFGFVFMAKERADEVNRRLAALDELTGVANRRSIVAALDRDVGRAIRTREPLAVMMVDIDFFKHVNDSHGHLAGDRVLRNVADVIRSRIRAQDIVGRYGGEEFLVVLVDTPAQGALQLAEQLRGAVQASSCHWGTQRLSVTVSVGVFGGRLEPGDNWDQLIHAADSALYRAKQGGRNRVEMAPALERPVRAGLAAQGPETLPSTH